MHKILLRTSSRRLLMLLASGSVLSAMLEGLFVLSVLAVLSETIPVDWLPLSKSKSSNTVLFLCGLLAFLGVLRLMLVFGYLTLGERIRSQMLEDLEKAALEMSIQKLRYIYPVFTTSVYATVDTVVKYWINWRTYIPALLTSIVLIAALVFLSPWILLALVGVLVAFGFAIKLQFEFLGRREMLAAAERTEWVEILNQVWAAVLEVRLNRFLARLLANRFSDLSKRRTGHSVS